MRAGVILRIGAAPSVKHLIVSGSQALVMRATICSALTGNQDGLNDSAHLCYHGPELGQDVRWRPNDIHA